MIIRQEHVEFAVVQRLRELLQRSHEPYEVTGTYAFFTAILCWTAQRLRTDTRKDASRAARAAEDAWKVLNEEPIGAAPWSIAIQPGGEAPVEKLAPRTEASPAFRNHSAQRFIKNLRDAVAHGDSRTVEPVHAKPGGRAERTLVGFRFRCEERKDKKPVWSGDVVLLACDMARIADEVAKRFCDAMEAGDPYFHEDVRKGVPEAA